MIGHMKILGALRELLILIALVALVVAPQGSLQTYAVVNVADVSAASVIRPYSTQPSPQALKWANKQLKRMSLEEKIGQLISVGVNATFLNQDSDAFRML